MLSTHSCIGACPCSSLLREEPHRWCFPAQVHNPRWILLIREWASEDDSECTPHTDTVPCVTGKAVYLPMHGSVEEDRCSFAARRTITSAGSIGTSPYARLREAACPSGKEHAHRIYCTTVTVLCAMKAPSYSSRTNSRALSAASRSAKAPIRTR
jgi:hypothetical protein